MDKDDTISKQRCNEAEDYVEDYLKNKCIPYKRNVKIYIDSITVEIDFVIPGAVIEVKNEEISGDYSNQVIRISRQINQQKEVLDLKHMKYYFYNHKKFINDKLVKEFREIDVSYIIDVSNITCDIAYFYINNHRIVKTLAFPNNENYLDLYKNRLYISSELYNSCIVSMTDEELGRLNEYNPKIIKSQQELENPVIIGENFGNQRCYHGYHHYEIFNIFNMEYKRNISIKRYPTRHIPGYTKICDVCNRLFFIKFIKGDVCKFCITHKRVKACR